MPTDDEFMAAVGNRPGTGFDLCTCQHAYSNHGLGVACRANGCPCTAFTLAPKGD